MPVRPGPARVLVVSGPPCGGKSWLAQRLQRRLSVPVVAKDPIKERLFDTPGWGTAEWSDALNTSARALMLDTVELLLAAGSSFIIESNLQPDRDSQAYEEPQRRRGFQAIQLHCSADVELPLARYRGRWLNGQRHPGHADDRAEASVSVKIRAGLYAPLPLRGPLLRLDTGNPRDANEATARAFVEGQIARIEREGPRCA